MKAEAAKKKKASKMKKANRKYRALDKEKEMQREKPDGEGELVNGEEGLDNESHCPEKSSPST